MVTRKKTTEPHPTADTSFLDNGGEMGERMRTFDWNRTPLGDIGSWPQSLKTATNIVLQSEVPMVMLWGTDGIMIYNDAYSIFAGKRHPQLLGSKVVEGWPEVADFNRNVMKNGLRGKKLSYAGQRLTLYRNNQPEDVWMNLNYSPIMDESGKPAGVLAVVIEITERVLAEQGLAAARAQLDSALAVGMVSAWTWNIKEDVIVGDANMERSFGISSRKKTSALTLDTILQSIHKEDRKRVAAAIRNTVEKGVEFEEEYRTLDDDGRTKWVIARGELQSDDSNEPAYLVGILIDITERKEERHDLEETKEKFDALFNSNIVAIAMAKTNGDILQANKKFQELFGYDERDIKRGLNSRQVSAPGETASLKSFYESISSKGEVGPLIKRYKHKKGTQFPALVGAAKLPTSDDTFMAFIIDVTENQRLKELNAIKDEFIALASHQLRTPASAVKQYLGVLLEGYAGELTEPQINYLKIANNANNRQLAILNDLLKTAQIDTKGYNLTLAPGNITRIVEEVISQYASTVDARDQKIILDTDEKNHTVMLDPTEMSICIANLIENASKYSPNNTTITVRLRKQKKHVKLTVTDQGVGIDEKDQEKIFDKFTRVSNDLSESVSGSGLGLYWVKRIVSIHNGTIKIKSKLGKGTSFIVRLPI